MWYPALWSREASDDRIKEFDRWEHDTIRPKYGLLHGIEYTLSSGVAEIDAYAEFFGGFRTERRRGDGRATGALARPAADRLPAAVVRHVEHALLRPPGEPERLERRDSRLCGVRHRRRADLPAPDAFEGPDGPERRRRWVARNDFQVFRNRAAYPRTWVVHDARSLPFSAGSGRAGRDAAIRAILSDSSDPHRTAWLDADKRVELTAYLPGTPPLPSEMPAITVYGRSEVVLDVALERPGLVVLADTYAPGWRLDDRWGPSPHPPRQPR